MAFITIPTTGIIANTFLVDYIQESDETNHTWTDIKDPATVLLPKQGYGLQTKPGKATNHTLTGRLLTGQQTQTITFTEYSTEPGVDEESNLLDNP